MNGLKLKIFMNYQHKERDIQLMTEQLKYFHLKIQLDSLFCC